MHGPGTTQLAGGRSPATIFPRARATSNWPKSTHAAPLRLSNPPASQTHFSPPPSTPPHGASRPDGATLHHGCNTYKHLPILDLQTVISASWCNFRARTICTATSRPKPTPLPPRPVPWWHLRDRTTSAPPSPFGTCSHTPPFVAQPVLSLPNGSLRRSVASPMVHPRPMVQHCTMGATPAIICQYATYGPSFPRHGATFALAPPAPPRPKPNPGCPHYPRPESPPPPSSGGPGRILAYRIRPPVATSSAYPCRPHAPSGPPGSPIRPSHPRHPDRAVVPLALHQ
jgi:hypothetical protein